MLHLLAFLLLSPPDNPDKDFLDALRKDGITYSSTPDIILYAHGVCIEMQTQSFTTIVGNIVKDFKAPEKIADHLASDAILSYCPDYWGKVINDGLYGGLVQ